MSKFTWYLTLILSLVGVSIATYSLQVYFFQRNQDTFFYMMQDFAFVPLQVLFVTLILDRLMKKRERSTLINKLNMLVGIFFHEIGYDMIQLFMTNTTNLENFQERLIINNDWTNKKFDESIKYFKNLKIEITLSAKYLNQLKKFLNQKQDLLYDLLKNPNLLEHETFTDLLWAGFHLQDELYHRETFNKLPKSDIIHLKSDLMRVYSLLLIEWLTYIRHLKSDYPYLFSVAIRTNPFDKKANITITN